MLSGIWLFGTQVPVPPQHCGNVKGTDGAASSQPIVPQAPVLAPVSGSLQGTQRWDVEQVEVSSVGRDDTAGRHVERHRPCAGVPANAAQLAGFTLPAALIRSSGVQRPAVAPLPHVASCPATVGGTYALGRQCAPEQLGLHPGKIVGSMTAGPLHGHVKVTGGRVGASQPSEHAPVAAVGCDEVGS